VPAAASLAAARAMTVMIIGIVIVSMFHTCFRLQEQRFYSVDNISSDLSRLQQRNNLLHIRISRPLLRN
jgi:hypothetical protein